MSELTMTDVTTLIGHAEYLRAVRNERDMPLYFLDLAERIALSMNDREAAKRCAELKKRVIHPPIP